MAAIDTLNGKKEELLAKLSAIQEACEGTENPANAAKVHTLEARQAALDSAEKDLQGKLSALKREIAAVSGEIGTLRSEARDRLLEAIKEQECYYIRNKPKVIFNKQTGVLWENLDYFEHWKESYTTDEAKKIRDEYSEIDGITGWNFPEQDDFLKIPFLSKGYRLRDRKEWWGSSKGYFARINSENGYSCGGATLYGDPAHAFIILCTHVLVEGTDYESDVAPGNTIYTEKEKLQFTLDLFVKNDLQPIFDDPEVTELYRKMYVEKPALLKELEGVEKEIAAEEEKIRAAQAAQLLSSEFDYHDLLAKYDIAAADGSVIQYYLAVERWTDELLEKLDYYEEKKADLIRDFGTIGLALAKTYADDPHLTEAENRLLAERQKYFKKKFSLGMNDVKLKLLSVKKQAEALEDRIEEIDAGDDALRALALGAQEPRAGFALVAENTAKIVRDGLLKMEYFEANRDFCVNAVRLWEAWTEDFRVFRTTHRDALWHACEEDGIEREVFEKWYADWQKIRFHIEEDLRPVIERGLKGPFPTLKKEKKTVPEALIAALGAYRDAVDAFFLEERKGIYQNFVFQSGGDLQEKLQAEMALYKCAASFQTSLGEILFNCSKSEDRVWILNWAKNLLDRSVDEVLQFVADNDLSKISKDVLDEFAELKEKNYTAYISDAAAYAKEKARREKQYNSLLFKMRKDLVK